MGLDLDDTRCQSIIIPLCTFSICVCTLQLTQLLRKRALKSSKCRKAEIKCRIWKEGGVTCLIDV